MHHTDTSPISTGAAPILQVHDVVKDFGGVRAVDHCTLTVMPGTITGLIGPNGAGKRLTKVSRRDQENRNAPLSYNGL